MDELGKVMLKHCGGLPLAIVALGGILATKNTIHEWVVVSKNMSSYLTDIIQEGGGDRVLSVLELSYDDLPFYLKPCFMYLGCFPEDYEIPADRLYHLWEAEGLVTMPKEINGARLDDIAESYLNQLVNRSMVQVEKRWPNGSIVSCRLHDVMRDMCLSKCRELNFLKIAEGGNPEELSNCNTVCSSLMNRKMRRTIIHLKGKDEQQLDWNVFSVVDPNEAPYIRSLLAFLDGEKSINLGHSQSSQKLSKGLSLLRALDLEGFYETDGVDFVRYGIHLRYLRLRGYRLYGGMIDYISVCKYLETLDLQYEARGVYRMSNELWKLERLRHLYLPFNFIIKDSSKLRLTRIQLGQLETFVNFAVDECQIEDLEKMTNLRILSFTDRVSIENMDALLHLFKSPAITNGRLKSPLKLRIGTRILEEDPTILTSPSLNSIFITQMIIWGGYKSREEAAKDKLGERSNNDLKIFPRTLMELKLRNCSIRKEDILEMEKLPCLENLKLNRSNIEGGKMIFSLGGFKKMLKLTLRYLSDLEEWEVGEGALPNLLSLEVDNCRMLKRIPEGLPASMKLRCSPRGINGSEMYKQF